MSDFLNDLTGGMTPDGHGGLYIPGDPREGETFEEWYANNHGGASAYSLGARIGNWFSGRVDAARDSWDHYWSQNNITSAAKQYEQLGLNPAIMMTSGGTSNVDVSKVSKSKSDSELLTSALKVIALLLLTKGKVRN